MTKDWTVGPDGRSNTSPEFVKICGVIEGIIRNSAFDLMGGRAGTTAGVIAAQLAHVHGFAPRGKLPGTLVEALRFAKYEFEKAGDRQSASVMTLALAEYDEVGGTTERVHDAATALLESVHDLLRRLEPDDAESERAIAVVEHAAALKAALLGAPETMQRLHQRAEHEKDLRLQAEDRERTALNSARGVRVAALHEAANLLEAPGYDDRCAEMADRIRDFAAQAETQRVPRCKICHAEPNGAGRVEHGRGCRALRPGGGGVEYVDMPHRSFSSSVLSGTATKADLRLASIAMGMMHTHHALCEAWNSMEPSERTQTAREFAEILADSQVADEYSHTYVTGTPDWLRLQAARLSERVDASEETRDTNGLVDSRVQHSAFITEEMALREALKVTPAPQSRPTPDAVHPTATVLGECVATTDVDFKDLAYCYSPLGLVSFSRARMNRWEWYLETIHREADDFDTISCSHQFQGLEAAASDCDKQLRALVKKAQALL